MSAVLGVLILGPLASASLAMIVRHHRTLRDGVTVSSMAASTALSGWVLFDVERAGTSRLVIGGWTPELGIELVADLFAALVLVAAMGTILLVQLYAIGERGSKWGSDAAVTAPVMLVLSAGTALTLLTGDLFTLFVGFELILVASYVLLTHRGQAGQVRSGMTYLVMNLLSSTFFLFGVAFVYRSTGTINYELLSQRIPELDMATRAGIGLWFLVVFGTKAAVFPLFSWLPDSYPTAPTNITAIFAGLLTKIGAYTLIRFHTTMAMEDLGPAILTVAGFTMLIGVAGALAQNDVKRILSFHIVSQIGYMLMGLGLFTVAGIAGAIFFLVHQIPTKTVLFLVGGLIERSTGTSALGSISGLIHRQPLIALLFAIPALSLAGVPPFSGFVGKLALVDAGVAASSIPIVAIAVGGSLLTLLSMSKIWIGVFWGEANERASLGDPPAMMRLSTLVTVASTLLIAALAGPIFTLSQRAAEQLLIR